MLSYWKRFILFASSLLLIFAIFLLIFSQEILNYGVVKGNLFLVKLGLNFNLKPEFVPSGLSLLETSISNGELEIFRLLLDNGANPNFHGYAGKTPVHLAAESNDSAFLKALSDFDPVLEIKDNNGDTPLLAAMFARSSKNVFFLIENEVNLNIRNKNGISPIFLAVEWNREDILKKLVKSGATELGKNTRGKTALDLALEYEDQKLIEILQTIDLN